MGLKKNTTALAELLEMANGLSEPAIEPLAVTKNGTYTAPEGVDGYSPITVDVPVPDGYIVPSGELEVTENGIHNVAEYASVNVNVTASGDTSAEDGIIDGTLTEYRNDRITSIRDYAFYHNTYLISADFPNVKTVGKYTFYQCTNLTTLNLQNVETLDNYALTDCNGITELSMPKIEHIKDSAVRGCSSLTMVNFPNLTTVDFGGFRYCAELININMPILYSINKYAFEGCKKLAKVDLPMAYGLYQYTFGNCTSLETLILRRPTMCALNDVKALYATPIANGTGYVYVPAALVDTYKSATNWSAYADQIRAIEDYPEITGG